MECVLTDALARYHRLRGEDVRFLTGTDENSLKNVQAAEKEGIPTADAGRAQRRALPRAARVARTSRSTTSSAPASSRATWRASRKLWEACDRNGDIYQRPYKGLYCVGCEQFYTEDELIDGLCPEH